MVGGTTCAAPNVEHDAAGRITEWPAGEFGGWRVLSQDGEGRILEICDLVCTGQSLHFYFAYDGEGRRTTKEYTEGGFGGTSEAITFRYDGDAVTAEYVDGVLAREYLVDESGGIVKMVIPSGRPNPGTYIVNWNGHGDALGLWRIKPDGSVELANTFVYGTWGGGGVQEDATNSSTGLPYGDLGFTFLYAGQLGVQDDDYRFGLGLLYMRARHYSPEFGRFLQPDPSAQEANLYGYANQNPVTNIDPNGTHFQKWGGGGFGGAWGRTAAQLGRAGEAAVRAVYNIGPKTPIQVFGRLRIPDGLTRTVLSEVKNVGYQAYTRQLRDYSAYARLTGRSFHLYVRAGATLSKPLLEAARQGHIRLLEIP